MRDPYEVLGVGRGASLAEIKAAYRRLAKQRYPDMPGGSHEAMVELNTAYAFLLNELKQGYQRQQEEQARQQSAGASHEAWRDVHADETRDDRRDNRWRDTYREIDEELETIRRAAEQYDERLRTMRRAAWATGRRVDWAKLTWDDLFNFLKRTARSGVKGVALLFAALVGVGSVLVEANFVSAVILLGSALGFAFSLALKSDKGGILSAGLLLFGVMTIWLPPVRNSLLLYPLATISILILLALIFKFAQAGGTVGLMTGGVLALYVIAVIVNDASRQPAQVATLPTPSSGANAPAPTVTTGPILPPTSPSPPAVHASPQAGAPSPKPEPTPPPTPPEPRTLLASQGAILKFVTGVPYHLKVRTGLSTSLRAIQGTIALGSDDGRSGACVDAVEFPTEPGAGPWREIDQTFRACGEEAVMIVSSVK